MSKIPISIEKIKVENPCYYYGGNSSVTETVRYLIRLEDNGEQWERTFICDRDDLVKLKSVIDQLIENTTTEEALRINNSKAKIVDEHYKKDKLCKSCQYTLSDKCLVCLFKFQSPLERHLFVELSKLEIKFQPFYSLNWKGEYISIEDKIYSDSKNNFKDVLTVVDFYIEHGDDKICVYTDGHTFHERTEDQVQRDRKIDRTLQSLGFLVLRYTCKDVKEDLHDIIEDIKKWVE